MAMSFSTLVGDVTTEGSIKYAINYTRIDSAGILTEAQAWIYQRLRVYDMLQTADVSIVSGESTADFPTGYLDPLHLGIPGVIPRIRLKEHEWFRTNLGWGSDAVLPSGAPTYWTNIGGRFQFNTIADQNYTAKFMHYARPAALSVSNETNWLTTRYPTLLKRACMIFSSEARKEWSMMDRAEVRALADIDEIKRESDLALRGVELDFNWMEN
jgi:hypothetical protein